MDTRSLKYHWRYLAFVTLWFRKRDAEEATLILLCFDLDEASPPPSGPMKAAFVEHFDKFINDKVPRCPYGVYVPLLEIIVAQYNRAVWTFRKPVRTVEKVNLHPF
jgi:hypothetical protein